jgi:hypothetical protein
MRKVKVIPHRSTTKDGVTNSQAKEEDTTKVKYSSQNKTEER